MNDRVEILAQAMWRGTIGETRVLPEWIDFATQNPSIADKLRNRAEGMIEVHTTHARNTKHGGVQTRHTHHSGLDWLFQ